jgi:hypothetical protein
MVVHRNLIQNIGSFNGDGELFAMKSSGMVIQYCTFVNRAQYLNFPRSSRDNIIRSCWIELGNNPLVRVECLNSVVIGCRFIGGQNLHVYNGSPGSGYYPPATTPDTWPHYAADNAKIIGNVLDTGSITVGTYFGSNHASNRVPSRNTLIAGNIRNGGPATTSNGVTLISGLHVGTTIQSAIPEEFQGYTVATKLLPSHVGMAAPDDLCPSGPQS